MGYTFTTTGADIGIQSQRAAEVHTILEGLPDHLLEIFGVLRDDVQEALTVSEALGLFGIMVSFDGRWGWTITHVTPGKWRPEYLDIFEALTRVVTSGSHIQFLGEDGDAWRCEFTGPDMPCTADTFHVYESRVAWQLVH